MVVAIICAAAVLVALFYLGVLVAQLLRRIKDLDTQLTDTRGLVAELNHVVDQAPRKAS